MNVKGFEFSLDKTAYWNILQKRNTALLNA